MRQVDEAIERIRKMEAIFDQAQRLMEAPENNKEEYLNYQGEIEKLARYYESPEWKADFALDEEGVFPKDLKRGILSEDGIYDLLDRNKEILEELGEDPEKPGICLCDAQEIDTGRLILRSFRHEDAESMFRNWLSDEEVQSMYGEPTYTSIEQVNDLIDRYIAQTEEGRAFRWEVIEKASGECIGQA